MGGRDQLRVDDAEALILSVIIVCILTGRKCNCCAIHVLLIYKYYELGSSFSHDATAK